MESFSSAYGLLFESVYGEISQGAPLVAQGQSVALSFLEQLLWYAVDCFLCFLLKFLTGERSQGETLADHGQSIALIFPCTLLGLLLCWNFYLMAHVVYSTWIRLGSFSALFYSSEYAS